MKNTSSSGLMEAIRPTNMHRRLGDRIHWIIIRLANNLKLIVVIYIASLLLAALLFSIFEHKSYGASLWWAVVTALTIGYGDIDPVTAAGRVTAVIFQHFWIFGIAPLVIANIVLRVEYDRDQFSNAEQEWLFERVRQLCEAQGLEVPPRPSDTDHGDVPDELQDTTV